MNAEIFIQVIQFADTYLNERVKKQKLTKEAVAQTRQNIDFGEALVEAAMMQTSPLQLL